MNPIGDLASGLRLPRGRCRWCLALLVAAVAGCGPSAEVSELPEAAKKSLIRKKVDVQPRTSTARPKGR